MSDRCSTPCGRGHDDYDYDCDDGVLDAGGRNYICVMTSMVIMLNNSEDKDNDKDKDNDNGNDNDNHSDI